jgi:cell division protein FtsZ
VQEAAKIITESIDKEAKVIFGAIRDDKLKKGEIRITVIATGFPTNSPRKTSLFQVGGKDEKKEEKKEEKKDASSPLLQDMTKKPENRVDAMMKEMKDDDEDWTAVPAFLRRGKK